MRGGPKADDKVDAVILCRVYMNGKTSMVMTVDTQLRKFLGISPRELIGFRLRTIKGHKLIVGEKLPLHGVANPQAYLAESLPVDKE